MSTTEAEDTAKAPSEGDKDVDNDDELKKQEEEKQLEIRMRHLRRRMVRAEQEVQELQRRVDEIKLKINKPIEAPRICPPKKPATPGPLKRRRRAGADENWLENPSEIGGAGDATMNARR